MAINPLTGEKKWEVPLTDLPSSAGMLATGGGLVFTGKLTGEFLALDEDTGKTLWQFKTGSSVNSTAITYTHKGRQYVTVAVGTRRQSWPRATPRVKCRRAARSGPSRYADPRRESRTHVFVEPVNGPLPGQIGRGFVVALWRGVAIEAVNGAGVDVAFMRNLGRR